MALPVLNKHPLLVTSSSGPPSCSGLGWCQDLGCPAQHLRGAPGEAEPLPSPARPQASLPPRWVLSFL